MSNCSGGAENTNKDEIWATCQFLSYMFNK